MQRGKALDGVLMGEQRLRLRGQPFERAQLAFKARRIHRSALLPQIQRQQRE